METCKDYRDTRSTDFPGLMAVHVTTGEFHDQIQRIANDSPFDSVSYCIYREIDELSGFHQLVDGEIVCLHINLNVITATFMDQNGRQVEKIERAHVYYIVQDNVYGVVYTYRTFKRDLFTD